MFFQINLANLVRETVQADYDRALKFTNYK